MKATNILKSKRGVAIENAILFILVVFSLCSLLTMIALIANYQFKIDNIVLQQDVDLDQIGEDFVARVPELVGRGNQTDYNDTHYWIINSPSDSDKCTLTVTSDADSTTVLLYVEAKLNNGKVEILSWRYSAPPTPETDPPNS